MRVSLRRSLGLLAISTSQKPLLPLLFPTVFSVVVAAGVATVLFCTLPTDECTGWLSTLLATLFGVLLAAAGSIWLFYSQREQNEDRRKQHLINALIAELQATTDRLNTPSRTLVRAPKGSGERDAKVVLTDLAPIVCEEAIRNALFTHSVTRNLTRLAQAMRQCTKEADLLRTLLTSQPMNPDDIARMYEVAKNVQGSERYVVLWCDTVLEGLEKQGIEIPPEDKYYSDPSKQASLEDLNRETQPIQGNE